jgi:hypothetical protein
MTQTQKFLKGIQNSHSIPVPKGKVARRVKRLGSAYRSRIDSLTNAHENKRIRLLKIRKEQERKAEEAAKAAKTL